MGTLGQIANQISALETQAAEQAAQEAVYDGVSSFFAPWGSPQVATANNALVTVNNQVRVSSFQLPVCIEVASITINLTTGAASSTVGLGIYTFDGSTLLLSGTGSSASAVLVKITLSTPVVIGPGLFLFAWTDTSNAVQASNYTGAAAWNTVVNDTNAHQGTAANSSSSGVLPSTTGAITGATINVPLVKFEGA